MNPFAHRARSVHGPSTDVLPVAPDDATDLPTVAIALYVETGGAVVVDTVAGETRAISVADFSILPPSTTQMGCNWVGCPDPIETALSGFESMQLGLNFLNLCVDLGLEQIADETTPPG